MNGENQLASAVVNYCFKIHKHLGPGLLESVYEEVLSYELRRGGFQLERQVPVAVVYEGVKMEAGFRADLIIERKLIVEIKSAETIAPVHQKQLLTYLKLTNIKLGILVNFNSALIKDGLQRIVNGLT